jgi:transcriptional regulator with XRE-family HTH domain
MKSLGKTLKEARDLSKFTLVQVEDATGISNAYLSQLENDKIKKPSANVLYKLSVIYNISLETLLAASGIIDEVGKQRSRLLNTPALSKADISDEEEKALLDYLKYLRYSKRNA